MNRLFLKIGEERQTYEKKIAHLRMLLHANGIYFEGNPSMPLDNEPFERATEHEQGTLESSNGSKSNQMEENQVLDKDEISDSGSCDEIPMTATQPENFGTGADIDIPDTIEEENEQDQNSLVWNDAPAHKLEKTNEIPTSRPRSQLPKPQVFRKPQVDEFSAENCTVPLEVKPLNVKRPITIIPPTTTTPRSLSSSSKNSKLERSVSQHYFPASTLKMASNSSMNQMSKSYSTPSIEKSNSSNSASNLFQKGNPTDSTFKFQEVVRDKATRKQMHGVDCPCCADVVDEPIV